jgi:hypothetical protein
MARLWASPQRPRAIEEERWCPGHASASLVCALYEQGERIGTASASVGRSSPGDFFQSNLSWMMRSPAWPVHEVE